MTVQLLSAYVGNNAVPSGELAELIRSTKAALAEESVPAAPAEEDHVPAVSMKASLASRDQILSLIDGKPYKSLKRHLSTRGLSPDEYRARYNLPATYPMVAPGYSEERRKSPSSSVWVARRVRSQALRQRYRPRQRRTGVQRLLSTPRRP